MPTIGGVHRQARTDREIRYWASYDRFDDDRLFFVAVFTEGPFGRLGDAEGTVSCASGDVPADLRVRSAVMSFIDHTVFGEARMPDPSWIGWRPGPYL